MGGVKFVTNVIVTILFACCVTQLHAAAVATETRVTGANPCCGLPVQTTAFDQDGGDGFSSAFSSIDSEVVGTGRASAALVGSALNLPTLRVDAFAEASSEVTATATLMQKYVYSGSQSDFTFDVTLEGVASEVLFLDAQLKANLLVILASDVDFSSDFSAFKFEAVPGATPIPGEIAPVILDEVVIDFRSEGFIGAGPSSKTDTVSFTLNDGDTIFFWASVNAEAERDAAVDAFNTFVVTVSGSNVGNINGLATVPVPAPLLLLLSGVGTLLVRQRMYAA